MCTVTDSFSYHITGKGYSMKKITIKNTDLELSPMGMGCVNAGIKWDGEDAFRIFDAFLDMGGTAGVISGCPPLETRIMS